MKKILITFVTALMALGGLAVLAQAGDHQDAQRLQMNQLPPAVQKVIKQEAAKHPLKSITMGDDEDSRLYEGKFGNGSKQIELKIAANGQVVSREIERKHNEDREEKDD